MAEFEEVIKQKNRMCDISICSSGEGRCPLWKETKGCDCHYEMVANPKKAEKIIMNWAKKHPPKTNRDKFEEVFGFEVPSDLEDYCPDIYREYAFGEYQETCPNDKHCEKCICYWDREYVEPKKESK